MKNFKQILLLILVTLCSKPSYAYDFEVDGIYYNVLDMTERTVEVTHSDSQPLTVSFICDYNYGTYQFNKFYYYNSYSGDINVPSKVIYKGREFSVIQIGPAAFFNQENITQITLPSSIKVISENRSYDGYNTLKKAGAFSGCTFKTAKVGNSTCLAALDYSQLSGSTALNILQELYLADDFEGDITEIFSSNSSLQRIVSYAKNPPEIKASNAFSNSQYMDLVVCIPEESMDSYMRADVWREFWNLKPIKKVKSISLDKKKIDLKPEEIYNVQAKILPEDAFDQKIFWSSSNPDIAQVNENGIIIGKNKGDVVITATTTDGSNLSATLSVHVDCLVESIKLNSNAIILEPSGKNHLSVAILPEEAFVKDVVWKSLDNTVASVDNSGNVTAGRIGKTKIIVTTTDGTKLSDTCEVMVTNLSQIESEGLYFKVGLDGAIVISNPNGIKYSGAIEIPNRIVIPDFASVNVTTIAKDAFSNATGLTKIALPATITNIGTGAFSGCSALEFVGVENGSKLSANFDQIFADSKIKELYLGSDNISFNTNSKLLSGLRSVVIGNSVTKLPDVAVCNKNLERFVIETGEKTILEPSDYCCKSYKQTYSRSVISNKVYYEFGFLVTIIHLNPLANLIENKTLKYVHFGRELEGVNVDKPASETKPTSAGSRYSEYGYKDEYNYQYQEYITKTDYQEVHLSSITLNKDKAIMKIGETVQLNVVNKPTAVPTTNVIKWSSSNENVALVDVFGKVVMVGEGEATIIAQTLDGTELSTSCNIIYDRKNYIKTQPTTDNLSIELAYVDPNATYKWYNLNYMSEENIPELIEGQNTSLLKIDRTLYNSVYCSINLSNGQQLVSDTVKVRTILPTVVKLSSTKLNLLEGETKSLSYSILPLNSEKESVTWISENNSVAKVSSKGEITALSPGKTTVTILTSNNTISICEVNVYSNVHEYVDLGLPSGLLWATYDMGAYSAADEGTEFVWGGTSADTKWEDIKDVVLQYNEISNTEYDAAKVLWGNGWRLPTADEVQELMDYCKKTRLNNRTIDGWSVSDYEYTGPNGKSIYFYNVHDKIWNTYYMTGTLAEFRNNFLMNIGWYSVSWSGTDGCAQGQRIRPVINGVNSGIQESGIEESSEYRVYNLNGICLIRTKDKSELNKLPQGIYIINGRKMHVK